MRRSTTNAGRLPALLLMVTLACPMTAWSQEAASAGAEEAASEVVAADSADGAEGEVVDPPADEPAPPKPLKAGREHTAGEKTYDALVLRPFDFLGLCVSSVAFLPAAILTAPSGRYEVETALDLFVIEPSENVFERPLGRF